MKVLFLGGPGNISESTITDLLASGAEVAVLKRSRSDLFDLEDRIEVIIGDRDDEVVLTAALAKVAPQIVIDATCFTTEQANTVVRALQVHPPRRFIFVSTGDVYGYPLSRLPMAEDDPWGEPNGDYARDKRIIEELYRDALRETEVGYTIVRPGYSLGKTFALSAFAVDGGKRLVARIRQGKPVYSPGDGTTLIDAGAAYNTGKMIARICRDDATIGQDYNCAHHEAMTYDDYLHAFGAALDKPVEIVHIPTDFLFSLDRDEVKHSLLGDLSQFHLYFSVEKIRRQFPDFTWEYSLTDAIKDYIAYQESVGGFDGADEPTFEDELIEVWTAALESARAKLAR